MKYKPLHDYILVKPKEVAESKTIVAVTKKDSNFGTVVAVGPGKVNPITKERYMPLSVGDEVIFVSNIIQKEKIDGVEHFWMALENVIGMKDES